MLDDLAVRTLLPPEVVRRTCFAEFDGVLYEARHQVGKNRWVLPAGMYNRNRKAYGLQSYPECLSEDPEPYFRRAWRLACITVCVRHDRALRDRCAKCDSPVVFFRGPRGSRIVEPITLCHECRFDLRHAADVSDCAEVPEDLPLLQRQLERALRDRWIWVRQRGFVAAHLYFTGLRQVVRLLAAGRSAARFRAIVCERYGRTPFAIHYTKHRDDIEQLGLDERSPLLALGLALLAEWPDGFVEVCKEARTFVKDLLCGMRSVPFWSWIVVHENLDKTKYDPTIEEIAWFIAKNEEFFGGRYVPPNRRIRDQSIWNAQGINLNPLALQARRKRLKQQAAKAASQQS